MYQKAKNILIVITTLACVILPFLMPSLKIIYKIQENDTSPKTFDLYRSSITPILNLSFNATFILCTASIIWLLYDSIKKRTLKPYALFFIILFTCVNLLITLGLMIPSRVF